jgi:prepilin-type N-terminal cleavage/methylation domain-containing protein
MKLTRCRKRKAQSNKNAGFSLVEVLIAMAVLAVISLPILSAFSNAARINSKARREENANTVAQDVAEQFKSLSIDELTQMYSGNWNESEGVYQFAVTNPTGSSDYEGLNGEKFKVKVTLDPGAYTDGSSENKNANNANNINSYAPQYSNLNAADNIVIMKEVYQSDAEALAAFKTQYGVSPSASQLTKSLELDVDITQNGTTANFIESVTGKLVYTFNGTYKINREFTKSKSVTASWESGIYTLTKAQGLENIFLLYTPYDKNGVTVVPGLANAYLASDSIKINYNYPTGASVKCADCNVYLVQQDATSAVDASYKMYLNKENISVHINDTDGSAPKDLITQGTLNLGTGIESGPVCIYSNIYGWNSLKKSSESRGNGVTSNGAVSNINSLYTMTVTVSYDSDTFATVSTTKEN